MRIASGITTSHRDPDTLRESLASLSLAGFTMPHIFAEPDAKLCRRVRVVRNKTKLGPWRNFKSGLRFLLANYPGADAYAMFQDDIEVSAGLRPYLDLKLFPAEDCGVVSIYTPEFHQSESTGMHPVTDMFELQRMYGALAYLFPGRVAKKLVDTTQGSECLTKTDQWVARFCIDEGLSYWHHSPSLVRHLAVESSSIRPEASYLHNHQYRQCGRFCEDACVFLLPGGVACR